MREDLFRVSRPRTVFTFSLYRSLTSDLSFQLSISRWAPFPPWTYHYPGVVGVCVVYVSIFIITRSRVIADLHRILLNVLYCAKINRDKRKGKYDQYAGYNDDRNPEFMMVL